MRSTDSKPKLPRANAGITTYNSGCRVLAIQLNFFQPDLAPKFNPVLSSPRPLDLHGRAVLATGTGAEP